MSYTKSQIKGFATEVFNASSGFIKQVLTDAATITIDTALANLFDLPSLGATRTLVLSNIVDKVYGVILIGATNGYDLIYNNGTIDLPASGPVIVTYIVNGSDVFFDVSSATKLMNTGVNPPPSGGGGSSDDALAYIAAIEAFETLSSPIKTAITNLVSSLKSGGYWTKMKAIYPIVGSLAASHKFNLKNPVNTDAAFRLNFVGGTTHGFGGISWGAGKYADSFITPSTHLQLNNLSIGMNCRLNMLPGQGENYCLFGVEENNGGNIRLWWNTTDQVYQEVNSTAAPYANAQANGMHVLSRANATQTKFYRNGAVINTLSNNSNTLPPRSLYFGASHTFLETAYLFMPAFTTTSFMYVGESFTDAEQVALNTIIQNFETAIR